MLFPILTYNPIIRYIVIASSVEGRFMRRSCGGTRRGARVEASQALAREAPGHRPADNNDPPAGSLLKEGTRGALRCCPTEARPGDRNRRQWSAGRRDAPSGASRASQSGLRQAGLQRELYKVRRSALRSPRYAREGKEEGQCSVPSATGQAERWLFWFCTLRGGPIARGIRAAGFRQWR